MAVIPSRGDGEGPLKRTSVTHGELPLVRQCNPRGLRKRIRAIACATVRSLAVCAAQDDGTAAYGWKPNGRNLIQNLT
jgi:hypothetical protein